MKKNNFRKILLISLLGMGITGVHNFYGMQPESVSDDDGALAAAGLAQLIPLASYADFVDGNKQLTVQAQQALTAADTDLKKATYWQALLLKALETVPEMYFKILHGYYTESYRNKRVTEDCVVPERMTDRTWSIVQQRMPKTYSFDLSLDVIKIQRGEPPVLAGVINVHDGQGQALTEAVAAIAQTLKTVHVVVYKMCQVVACAEAKRINLEALPNILNNVQLVQIGDTKTTVCAALKEGENLDTVANEIAKIDLVKCAEDWTRDNPSARSTTPDQAWARTFSPGNPQAKRGIARRDFNRL